MDLLKAKFLSPALWQNDFAIDGIAKSNNSWCQDDEGNNNGGWKPFLAGGNLCRNDAVSLLEKDFVCFCLF